jgi:hypothetical protein
MAKKEFPKNRKANEPISKFKLLSAYGGPGSIVHTGFDCSILISCIEEWGFIQKIKKIRDTAIKVGDKEEEYVVKHAKEAEIFISNDERLLIELRSIKRMPNLKYLVLIPDIELNELYNTLDPEAGQLAINSTFLPKGFFDRLNQYQPYWKWYDKWPSNDLDNFFPPKYKANIKENEFEFKLKQDNIVLICESGHISDFPWSKYLRWRKDFPYEGKDKINLFDIQDCCTSPMIQIKDTSANASGFDGKWLKCNNKGCQYHTGVSLKGLMSVKVSCPGHKPWETETGAANNYYGSDNLRKKEPQREECFADYLKVALTTGNNLYYSRILSSIYMPRDLFLDPLVLKERALNIELEEAKAKNDFAKCVKIAEEITKIRSELPDPNTEDTSSDQEKEQKYRFQEYNAFTKKEERYLNVDDDLVINDVTDNLDEILKGYFSRVLRIDNLKVTSTQLDFSRVFPKDADSDTIVSKNIFRSLPNTVLSYPVVENYGEGIFFGFDTNSIDIFTPNINRYGSLFKKKRSDFALGALNLAKQRNWQLYLVHTFCHLIMRELEFRCGYPTASLSERIYVSNDPDNKMYGCMIYTSEGSEGSMGGLIAQTRPDNINNLIRSALKRATVCNSDPLCWESDGQGLFELNLASCFSCSLTSETSCELRNLYLDRSILVDEETGYFKEAI